MIHKPTPTRTENLARMEAFVASARTFAASCDDPHSVLLAWARETWNTFLTHPEWPSYHGLTAIDIANARDALTVPVEPAL